MALFQRQLASEAFASKFPITCRDGNAIAGTDTDALSLAIQAEIPGLAWPLQTQTMAESEFTAKMVPFAPDTLLILDFIELCHRWVAKPIKVAYHKFFSHHHLEFDDDAGKSDFRDEVNRVFARNGVAFDLRSNGCIVRLAPAVLGHSLAATMFQTGDATLDNMLEECRKKFLDPDPKIRREGLERLWDCWERIKSLDNRGNKKQSVAALLNKAASNPAFRGLLEQEAKTLTDIGNSFHIRHSEVRQTAVTDSAEVDYLFHRLFSIIQLLLQKRTVKS